MVNMTAFLFLSFFMSSFLFVFVRVYDLGGAVFGMSSS